MPFMLLDAYLPSTYAPGCCTNQLYALLFDDSDQALKDNGSGTLTLQSYTQAAHNDFAIVMAEAVERTKYFFVKVDTAFLSLPALAKGKYYFLEIWRHEGALPRVRASDELIEARRVKWDGSVLVDAVLGDAGEAAVAEHVCYLSTVYNSATLEMHFMAWLEKNGQIHASPTSMNLLWKDSSGVTLANVNQSSTMVDMPGVYSFSMSNVSLNPDEVTIAKLSITANGVTRESVSSIVAWD